MGFLLANISILICRLSRTQAVFFVLFFQYVGSALADNINVGNVLPRLDISDRGELFIHDGRVSFRPWTSTTTQHQVRVIQYLAARLSAGEINDAFSKALERAKFPTDKVVNIGILNADDSIVGTSLFLEGKLKSEKIRNPAAMIIIDDQGVGRKRWNLEKASSAIIIANEEGVILFFRDGALNKDDVANVLRLIRDRINIPSDSNND